MSLPLGGLPLFLPLFPPLILPLFPPESEASDSASESDSDCGSGFDPGTGLVCVLYPGLRIALAIKGSLPCTLISVAASRASGCKKANPCQQPCSIAGDMTAGQYIALYTGKVTGTY